MREQTSNFQKKIKDYVISYCPTEYYGKNIHGQIRSGYKVNQNKIIVFRIVPLPLTPSLALFLSLQQHYAGLTGYARLVYQPVHSSSNHYVPLQYFPKTFHSQSALFKSNPKYFDQFVQKFLRVYAFFYNMRVTHGNLTAHNIGITFQGKVKLMDFSLNDQQISFENRAHQDFIDFKQVIAVIMEKDGNFAYKFGSFNSQKNSNWEHLFSLWHVTSPLEPLYLSRKLYIENIVTLLYKLYSSLEANNISENILISVRLLMINYLKNSKSQHYRCQCDVLQSITGNFQSWDFQKINSLLIGAIKDPQYNGLSPEQRLVLVSCLIPALNHQYIYFEIISEFNSDQKKRNQLLGDSLYSTYRFDIFQNLLKAQ